MLFISKDIAVIQISIVNNLFLSICTVNFEIALAAFKS